MNETAIRVIDVIRKEMGELHMANVRGAITPDSHLGTDIGMTSMDVLCATVGLDEEFGVEISDVEVQQWETVADVISCVERHRAIA